MKKEGEILLGRLSEEERGKLYWEYVGSTSIKVFKSVGPYAIEEGTFSIMEGYVRTYIY